MKHPGEGHGNPLQYSRLENPENRGAWRLLSMGLERVTRNWNDSMNMRQGRAGARVDYTERSPQSRSLKKHQKKKKRQMVL